MTREGKFMNFLMIYWFIFLVMLIILNSDLITKCVCKQSNKQLTNTKTNKTNPINDGDLDYSSSDSDCEEDDQDECFEDPHVGLDL